MATLVNTDGYCECVLKELEVCDLTKLDQYINDMMAMVVNQIFQCIIVHISSPIDHTDVLAYLHKLHLNDFYLLF